MDARALAADLRRAIDGEVRFGAGSRALYANDASSYRQVPIGVVVPRTLDDVEATVEVGREHGAPLFGRGTGTGLAGQSVNDAVLIDFTKYLNEIIWLDPDRHRAHLRPRPPGRLQARAQPAAPLARPARLPAAVGCRRPRARDHGVQPDR